MQAKLRTLVPVQGEGKALMPERTQGWEWRRGGGLLPQSSSGCPIRARSGSPKWRAWAVPWQCRISERQELPSGTVWMGQPSPSRAGRGGCSGSEFCMRHSKPSWCFFAQAIPSFLGLAATTRAGRALGSTVGTTCTKPGRFPRAQPQPLDCRCAQRLFPTLHTVSAHVRFSARPTRKQCHVAAVGQQPASSCLSSRDIREKVLEQL